MSVRMMLFSFVDPEREQEFEAAFSKVRERVATMPGHIRDELLRLEGVSGSYVLISEWEKREQFTEWLESPAHDSMTAEMRPYFVRPSEMRFYSLRVPSSRG
ncbi:antibiotic biosynthesis monooxygenase family protein [Nonomuraea pusilla]|uniref:Heme-degrading monooxygenase HmoA n=1 Tax=Nonomuraea pusilla TaxID=46177 RepID=A0A1H8CDS6_9ACTN|nr:antibiotic biosynthesis monooxygenase family protein [Nonomuraea pusilla]SEM92418.1 Heme-degrading monooxygenase HmoA [Nonomuraea pusilla]